MDNIFKVGLVFAVILVVGFMISEKDDIKLNFTTILKGIGAIAILSVIIFTILLFICGLISSIMENQYTKEIMSEQYELVSFDTTREYKGEIDGNMFLLCGSISGEIGSEKRYEFWYKREDGGLLPGTINSDDATIVVYETNEIKPQYVVFKGWKALPENYPNRRIYEFFGIDTSLVSDVTEYRFYVPVGTFRQQGYNLS